MDSARHFIGSHLATEMRVQNAFADVATTIHQSLPRSGARRWRWRSLWGRRGPCRSTRWARSRAGGSLITSTRLRSEHDLP